MSHEIALIQVKIMYSHNAKTHFVAVDKSVRIVNGKGDVRVITSNLTDAADLSIREYDDEGSDPYNSTGQHVIIKTTVDLQD
jgi:hypothetical protein